ncbi:MAG: hypothetical protein Q4P16_06680 [Spirochaetales bacterium]|nr:hypothetical protein [Spirochaetales bacterium]
MLSINVNGKEIDFLASKNGREYLIQIAYDERLKKNKTPSPKTRHFTSEGVAFCR